MTIERDFRRAALFLCLLGLAGCQTLLTSPGTQAVPLEADPQQKVTVEVRPHSGKPTRKQLPLRANMRLQDVVAATSTKFHGKDIYIVRVSPRTGRKHKLTGVYDRAQRRITIETDYALQPDDQVVIVENTTTSLERVMKSFLGRS